ncbi:LOW QUALITY PROTEIN: hypothetical protein U9M48_037269 [Paspalum notatum var. saurae]|uniref:Reverse transcriptase zinc-binding domain-containing protein n=1 Tax=Paspalum notatum var. saurae TaxID=547442 RepID=A0AAQ3XAW7_PASNO
MFLRPNQDDLLISQLLKAFGHASGLRTNLAKSSVSPINCTVEDLQALSELLGCEIRNFPCSYLGIPLTIQKPTKNDLLPLIDKISSSLPKWKASLLSRAGRLVVVRAVFSAIPIHVMLALDLPKWVVKAINKLRRGYLWVGRQNANGGNCLVSWEKVQRPLQYGGLGILNLETMGWALRIRWLWLQKTDSSRPWEGLPIQVPRNAQALFHVAVETRVGNGDDTKFWTDRWLHGSTVGELAPNLFQLIPKIARRQRSVSQALTSRRWVADIQGALTTQVLVKYLKLWGLVEAFTLQPTIPDQHIWKLTSSGQYSSKSAYNAFFLGSVKFAPWKRTWKTWAPRRCKIFIWLAIKNRVWTADRLLKHGLPHPSVCTLCDQNEMSCVFSRETWTKILSSVGLQAVAPQTDGSFAKWWGCAASRVPKEKRKGFNSLVILVAWTIWKHRNACGLSPNVSLVCQEVAKESELWCLARNRPLHELLVRVPRLEA